jgi:hypothetical protein
MSISPSPPAKVESLKNRFTRPGVGGILPMLKAGFFMLSSASANPFMCVIRNCSASLLPASSQKLISRS